MVPLVPGILFDVLRERILAAVGGVASNHLAGAHIFLVTLCLRRAGMFHLHRAIEDRDRRWRLIQINADRSVRNWRDQFPSGVNHVEVLGGCAQLCVDESMQDRYLGMKVLGWIHV
jgi:hypothetical protein